MDKGIKENIITISKNKDSTKPQKLKYPKDKQQKISNQRELKAFL